jgi:hypothetical protein
MSFGFCRFLQHIQAFRPAARTLVLHASVADARCSQQDGGAGQVLRLSYFSSRLTLLLSNREHTCLHQIDNDWYTLGSKSHQEQGRLLDGSEAENQERAFQPSEQENLYKSQFARINRYEGGLPVGRICFVTTQVRKGDVSILTE